MNCFTLTAVWQCSIQMLIVRHAKQKHHAFDDTFTCMYGKYKKTPLEIIKPYLIDYKVY